MRRSESDVKHLHSGSNWMRCEEDELRSTRLLVGFEVKQPMSQTGFTRSDSLARCIKRFGKLVQWCVFARKACGGVEESGGPATQRSSCSCLARWQVSMHLPQKTAPRCGAVVRGLACRLRVVRGVKHDVAQRQIRFGPGGFDVVGECFSQAFVQRPKQRFAHCGVARIRHTVLNVPTS
ncbi:hypothetical protein Poly59_03690 [Rubripirellula reticaptiva]|uniref:Uncharacterized protein n=1 Tax=Rubripirellula reticaptiva TaxID=2528013 RepID=A0A5C6F9A9_9BACT|nr:hypothetical protein Poly59_03690 [Rubripirellula reticaptiva]